MSRVLLLIPFGGLSNRLRALASGLWLKSILKDEYELTVEWEVNDDCACHFEELFVSNKKMDFRYHRALSNNSLIQKIERVWSNKLESSIIDDSQVKILNWDSEIVVKRFEKIKRIEIRTCQEFGDCSDFFNIFEPLPYLVHRINKYDDHFKLHEHIGMHIRRTDNSASIKLSPIDLFKNKIMEYLGCNPNQKFFVCSDDLAVIDDLKHDFGELITSIVENVDRTNKVGTENALIDMWCLSKTKKIYGSYWSSFSMSASRLSRTPMEVLFIRN